ncbi:MAG: HDOD domain-containing protein [Spartobacteria bacterium]|nr:HDOD domain-containing protein [Spartobacteria bacterium]
MKNKQEGYKIGGAVFGKIHILGRGVERHPKGKLGRVLAGLETNEMSTVPVVLSRILSISRAPDSGAEDLARLCEMDKATTARILRAANSIYFAPDIQGRRVDNLRDAIVRIGFRTAEEIALSATISNVFKASRLVGDYSLNNLWKHSMAVGIGNRLLFSRLFPNTGMDAFTAGLLHDMGIALEHQFLAEEGFYEAVQYRHARQSLLVDEEHAAMKTNHQLVGHAVAKKWNFPEHLQAVILHHHDPLLKNIEHENLIHVTRLSEIMCYRLSLGYSDFSDRHLLMLRESMFKLGVDEDFLEHIGRKLVEVLEAYVNIGLFSNLRLKIA